MVKKMEKDYQTIFGKALDKIVEGLEYSEKQGKIDGYVKELYSRFVEEIKEGLAEYQEMIDEMILSDELKGEYRPVLGEEIVPNIDLLVKNPTAI